MRIPTETEDIRNVQVATEIAHAMKWKTALFRVKKATDVREFSCLVDSIDYHLAVGILGNFLFQLSFLFFSNPIVFQHQGKFPFIE